MKLLVVFVIALASSTAVAGKPTAAKAKQAAEAWGKAMIKLDPSKLDKPDQIDAATLAEVTKLTSLPFRIVVTDDTGDPRECEDTITDRAKLAATFACLRNSPAVSAKYKPYTAKFLKELWGELRDKKPEIEKLAKTHTLVVHYERGEDVVELGILAVAGDPDGTARVAALYSAYLIK